MQSVEPESQQHEQFPAAPGVMVRVPFRRLYGWGMFSMGLVPVFMLVNLSLGLLMGEDVWKPWLLWLVGYLGVSLIPAGVAWVLLKNPAEAAFWRKLLYVVVVTLMLMLSAVGLWGKPEPLSLMGVVVLFFASVPILFLLAACRRNRREKSAASESEERGAESRSFVVVGKSLLECSLLAASPWLGMGYICCLMELSPHFELVSFLGCLAGIIIPAWVGVAVLQTVILWLLRLCRKWWPLCLVILMVALGGAGWFCCSGIAAWLLSAAIPALLPGIYVAQSIRQWRCPEETPQARIRRSPFVCALLAVLPLTGMAPILLLGMLILRREEAAAEFALMGGSLLLLLLYAVVLRVLASCIMGEVKTAPAARRVLYVLLACLVPSFPVFSGCMCSHITDFLAYAPGLAPLVILHLYFLELNVNYAKDSP